MRLPPILLLAHRPLGVVLLAVLLSEGRAHAFRFDGPTPSSAAVVLQEVDKAGPPTASRLAAARLATPLGLSVVWDSRLGTPSRVRGQDLARRGAFSPAKALAFEGRGDYAQDSLAVLDNLAGLYSFRDVTAEFGPGRVDADLLGYHHVRRPQMHQGRRVVGGQLIVHFDGADRPYEVSGRYSPDLAVRDVPVLSEAEAGRIAAQDLAGMGRPAAKSAGKPELVVYALSGPPSLAYEITLACRDPKRLDERWKYYVDAAGGGILLRYDEIPRIGAPTGNGSDTALSGALLGGEGGQTVSVTGWRDNTTVADYLYNRNATWYVYNVAASGYSDYNTFAWRPTANWGSSDRAEVSAGNNIDIVQDYFRTVHGRNSFDNNAEFARINVHEGQNLVNAYWDGVDFHIGDGDGMDANPLAVLDVVGHEFTHAVTESTAGLIYSGESGALDESFSDIFGACVEFYGQPDGHTLYPGTAPGQADWLVGEDCWISAKALRDIRNPGNVTTVGAGNELPSRYKGTHWYYGTGDNGGVHVNLSVQSFFFYLLCEGGSGTNDGIAYSVSGIGRTNAEKVAFRALTIYVGPYADYSAGRGAWVSAATDLNAAWVPSVEAAWDAVGVGPVLPTAAAPTMDPPEGAYSSVVTVSVATATVGASLTYTLDGTDPSSSSPAYTSAIPLSVDTTLKARAFKSGMQPSPVATARYQFLGTRLLFFPMDSSSGWTTGGAWAFGAPQGRGGDHGYPDPASGFTGANVYGYNLAGDYVNNLFSTYWLTTSATDLSAASNVKLAFRRWLGVEKPAFDHAYIEASANGATWTRVWENSAEIADSSWTYVVYDLSSVADGQSTVYIRWGIGPTDSSWTYCGWNIDDVEIWGRLGGPRAPAVPANLEAAAYSRTEVRLAWEDRADNEDGFAIERASFAGAWNEIARVGANVASFKDTTMSPNGSFSYRVRAFNAAGYSGYSNVGSASTADTTGSIRFGVSLPDRWLGVLVWDSVDQRYVMNDNFYSPPEIVVPGIKANRWYHIAVWDYTRSVWVIGEWASRVQ